MCFVSVPHCISAELAHTRFWTVLVELAESVRRKVVGSALVLGRETLLSGHKTVVVKCAEWDQNIVFASDSICYLKYAAVLEVHTVTKQSHDVSPTHSCCTFYFEDVKTCHALWTLNASDLWPVLHYHTVRGCSLLFYSNELTSV